MQETDNQTQNSKPWLWKKCQSGNILVRPNGKTMNEWDKEYLSRMTDEERDEFMHGIPKDTIWKLAEGNPETKSDVTSNGQSISTVLVKFIDGNLQIRKFFLELFGSPNLRW